MPTPRGWRPGFHASGSPVTGSRAATPGRGTPPPIARSRPCGLLSHRWWPPTYTAAPVTAVASSESPPEEATQVGCTAWPRPEVSKRAAASHSEPAR